MEQNAELCSGCRTALQESYHRKRRTYAKLTWSILNNLADSGCQICVWVRNSLQKSYADIAAEDWDDDYDFEIRKGFELARELVNQKSDKEPFLEPLSEANMSANVYFADEYEDEEAFFRVYLPSLDIEETWPDSYEPTSSTDDANTFELIKYWTDLCLKQHSSCHGSARQQWLPTRLIHVRRQEQGGISASLHEAALEDYAPSVNYLVLSHRWLPNEPLRLLKENHLELRNEIPLESLKPAIREAMELCLRLDTEYIWIDTICIVQDDPDDLDRELGDMHRIYGYAKCTIAAAVTSGGCFNSRDVRLTRNNTITLTLDGEQLKYRLKVHWGQVNANLQSCILGKRAWIFQERFLSPRILHFCNSLVHWECREREASEVYPKGKPLRVSSHANRLFRSNSQAPTSGRSDALSLPTWESIVSNYTGRSLTYPADRLRALSGVAAYCAEVAGDEYVYGLWRRTLPTSLLWAAVASEEDPVKKRLEEVAPSWSWASLTGSVMFNAWLDRPHELLAEFIDLDHVELPNTAHDDSHCQLMVRLHGTVFKGTVQGQLDAGFLTEYLYATSAIVPDSLTMRVVSDIGSAEDFRPFDAFFLPILFVEDVGTDGIMLQLLEDAVVPTYQRVGVFNVDGSVNFDDADVHTELGVC